MSELTNVEQYVVDKGWNYRGAGTNIAVEYCPFCHKGDYKFFINVDKFLWDCKRPDCPSNAGSKPGGNERKLKQHMGDSMATEVEEKTTSQRGTREVKVEGIPDYKQAHEWLLEDQGLMNYLADHRGWDFDLVKRMQIGIMNRFITDAKGDQGCFTYPYVINGKCEFVKFRTLPQFPKNFSSLAGRSVPLYNQDAVKKGMEYLVLVEGEADTISALSIGEENVVGVPGAGMKQIDWAGLLDYPGRLYLLFDTDEDGQAGAKKFAERFGIDKFHNIVIPEFDLLEPIEDKHGTRTKGKDLTEWVQAGNGPEQFKELLRSAQMFAIEGATTQRQAGDELRQEIVRRGTNAPQYLTQWESLNKAFGGAEDGQLIIFQAAQKTGKTSLCLNWADFLVQTKKINVLFECLEMPARDLQRKWYSYATMTDDSPGKLSYEELLKMIDAGNVILDQREYGIIFGFTTVTALDQEFDRLRSLIRRHGAKVVVFDNLQLLVDMLYAGEKQGGRPAFMSKVTKMFKSLAMEMNVLVILIAQTRSLDDEAVATAKSLEGSSAPGNDCDCMMIANRTKTMPVKNKSELAKLAQLGDNNLSTSTLNPELYIDVGLTRRAGGGLCILMIDGSRSLVYERDPATAMAAKLAAGGSLTEVGGIKVVRAENPPMPASVDQGDEVTEVVQP